MHDCNSRNTNKEWRNRMQKPSDIFTSTPIYIRLVCCFFFFFTQDKGTRPYWIIIIIACKMRFIDFVLAMQLWKWFGVLDYTKSWPYVYKYIVAQWTHFQRTKICNVRVTSPLVAAKLLMRQSKRRKKNPEVKIKNKKKKQTARTREMRVFEMWSWNGVKLHLIMTKIKRSLYLKEITADKNKTEQHAKQNHIFAMKQEK